MVEINVSQERTVWEGVFYMEKSVYDRIASVSEQLDEKKMGVLASELTDICEDIDSIDDMIRKLEKVEPSIKDDLIKLRRKLFGYSFGELN